MFLPNIMKIWQCFRELWLKTSVIFFRHSVYVVLYRAKKFVKQLLIKKNWYLLCLNSWRILIKDALLETFYFQCCTLIVNKIDIVMCSATAMCRFCLFVTKFICLRFRLISDPGTTGAMTPWRYWSHLLVYCCYFNSLIVNLLQQT